MLVNTGLIPASVVHNVKVSQLVFCHSYDMYPVDSTIRRLSFVISTALWWIRPPNPDLDRVSGDSNPCC